MTKVEATTLEEAYAKASQTLGCSISELQCEVVQYPTKGILGLLKKNAILIATKKQGNSKKSADVQHKPKETTKVHTSEKKYTQEVVEKKEKKDSVSYDALSRRIEGELKDLISVSCFDIDVVEVDVVDNTAFIFIDGEDAALLIGKEGYRYNAFSYMLFNWLHGKYELFIKLEIAEFLTSQQEMIKVYIQPVIEQVEETGRAKTRYLDGILVQIALELLRERFPNKYVAVKVSKDGHKFIVIDEFYSKLNG